MSKKQEYIKFCANNSIPIFSQPWWLDAVCGEEKWNVILVKKGDNILASMPYFLQKKSIFNTIYMPPLTQTMGPFVKYEKEQLQNYERKVSFETQIFNEIIDQIPTKSFFFQNFHHTVTNWLPFYWRGFKQSSYYTYILEDIQNDEDVLQRFASSKRRQVKKALKHSLQIEYGIDVETFFQHHKNALAEKKQTVSYPQSVLYNLVNKAQELNKGEVLGVKTKEGELLCCIFIVWDDNSAYSLVTSINDKSREYDASSLMFYEAIKYASKFVNSFDFEGSMVPMIEKSYRKFGTRQVPYFRITKANNLLLNIAEALHTSDAIK